MTPLERADFARQLTENPVFQAALSDIRAGLVSKLETCAMADIELQHEIALMLQLCRKLETQLLQYKTATVIDNAEKRQKSFIERLKTLKPV